ncbi:alkaline phosphatase family protein [Actinomadura harenae]|uniref:Acid phosphatase n=1 Tax=Actinomadura harenae TaxID=2483351 RepID=A0A3M2M1Y8_9ACTN|nr:alkaline phosphatase family protein [Actinomadura harenae]RMI43637.1 acid phosphatase [Actinomadura harenae]
MSGAPTAAVPRRLRAVLAACALALTGAAGLSAAPVNAAPVNAGTVPTPDHTVVVVFENHAYSQVVGTSSAPYLTSLANGGANLTQSYALTHPSQPNYFDLFSGSTQGVTDDTCPPPGSPYSTANLASELQAAGRTWASYNEGLPSQGSTTCSNSAGKYARKHNPWFSFTNVPASTGSTFAQFPTDYTTLPNVSFVIPNLCDDMHDCSVSTGDTWLKTHLDAYAQWATTHNSVLLVTFDEDNGSSGNQIATIFYGAHVKPGAYATKYTHYNVLRTLEDMNGTTHAGNAATATPITEIWQ